MAKEYDFILVGQGLAGTCLTRALQKLDRTVLIIDSSKLPSSSKVAAGLFNPITGRNMVLTWRVNEIFPFLQSFYKEFEDLLEVKILNMLPLYRPFATNEDLNEWQGRLSQDKFKAYIDDVYTEGQYTNLAKNPLGGVKLKQTGYLNTAILLTNFRKYLIEQDCLIDEKFTQAELNFIDKKIVYKGNLADKIIFCDGPMGFGSVLFEKIRFRSVKGEVLQLKVNDISEVILNRNAFILPREGVHIAGSTYDPNDKNWEITEEAKAEIKEKIDKLLNIDYKIIGHKAGLRPTTHDRKPVIGIHPDNPKIGIFNGLGAKGVSLAPFFANQFAEHLVNGKAIDKEVQIDRYFD